MQNDDEIFIVQNDEMTMKIPCAMMKQRKDFNSDFQDHSVNISMGY